MCVLPVLWLHLKVGRRNILKSQSDEVLIRGVVLADESFMVVARTASVTKGSGAELELLSARCVVCCMLLVGWVMWGFMKRLFIYLFLVLVTPSK